MTKVQTTTACACGDESTCDQATEQQLMARLDEVLTEYQEKPGALIPVLQIAQGIFGYLPVSAMKRVALRLGKSYSEVAGVVGFYSFFSTVPRGKHLVRVCLGTACYVRGGKQVLDPGWEVADPAKQRVMPDPAHPGESLIEQLPTGEWIERAPYFEAVAVTGEGVFDTLKAVSKLVLKALA